MSGSLIEWNDDFRIGIQEIDHEHEQMIALINTLHSELGNDPDQESVLRCLGEIHSKISAHFALEEKIMRERSYPNYTVHKNEHEQLLDQILDIIDQVAVDDPASHAGLLSRALNQWFGPHFRNEDARLHEFWSR